MKTPAALQFLIANHGVVPHMLWRLREHTPSLSKYRGV